MRIGRIGWGAVACAAAILPAAIAWGDVTYRYVTDLPSYESLPNGAVTVRVYLEETVTGGSASLLLAEHGLSGAGFRLLRDGVVPTQPFRIEGRGSVTTNVQDFVAPGDPIFGPEVRLSPGGNQLNVLVFAIASGATGIETSAGVRRVHLADVVLRAGSVANERTTIRIEDYDDTDDTVTWDTLIALDAPDRGIAPTTVTLAVSLPYPNERCVEATNVGDGEFSFSTGIASSEGVPEPACFGGSDPQISNDRWWRYSPPVPGTIKVFTCGSEFDTRIAVYGSTCPVQSGTTIACNDNYCGVQSSLFFVGDVGNQYLIRVGGRGASRGFGSLFITGCPADLDDGSGLGTRDGGVTVDDLLYFITLYSSGANGADLDDGSGTGTRDRGVTIDDLLYFLEAFARGC